MVLLQLEILLLIINICIYVQNIGNGIIEPETIQNGAGYFCKEKVYNCQIYDGITIIRNFIPCYATTPVTSVTGKQCSENTIGLYDFVEGKFYTNQGTGEFLKGKDIKLSDIPEWNYEIDENKKYIISNDGKVEQVIVEKKRKFVTN